MKNYYQIDRRNEDGTLADYYMILASSAQDALRRYLGGDYGDYQLSSCRINGKLVTTARCPEETSEYLEVSKAQLEN